MKPKSGRSATTERKRATQSVEAEANPLADKYHVALSFAGEDRKYVEAVAVRLQHSGVRVFYDKFEETKLWGKDLYTYLSDIYRNRALYTVVFASKAYAEKLWPNHERKAAQARAFSQSKECLLPAVFDESIEIPGVLKTTGYISLRSLDPEEFAGKILQKLREDGVFLSAEEEFGYSPEAKADVDFPLSEADTVTTIINALKSHDWYKQSPAVEKIRSLDWAHLTPDQAFVLGRNLYQCACGGERRATAIVQSIRPELARIPSDAAKHLLNGMFYEVYFDSKGEFRGNDLKAACLDQLFAIQTVEKYKDSIAFIRQALGPYREGLMILPNTIPEIVELKLKVAKKDPPLIQKMECLGKQVLVDAPPDYEGFSLPDVWKLFLKQFSLETLRGVMSGAWHVPSTQLKILTDPAIPGDMQLRFPKDKIIIRPVG
jgi:hypothetical protein